MPSIVTYRGYVGQIEVEVNARILFGRVINIKDIVTFEGKTVEEAIRSFREGIDDYCEERGAEAEKPFSGNIPFRTTPEVHRNIFIAARQAGKSINAWMNDILAEAAEKAINALRMKPSEPRESDAVTEFEVEDWEPIDPRSRKELERGRALGRKGKREQRQQQQPGR